MKISEKEIDKIFLKSDRRRRKDFYSNTRKTHEEAEQACLDKLIEIAKNM